MKFALLDSAILEGQRYFGLQHAIQAKSLFMGKTGELLDSVAPYLMQVKEDHESFISWFVQTKKQNTAGLILNANVSFEELHKHFRHFLYVKTEDQKKLYFRYYDPRILPTFLRTCTKDQLSEFFGPVQSFNVFTEDSSVIAFSLIGQKLREVTTPFDIENYKAIPQNDIQTNQNKLTSEKIIS